MISSRSAFAFRSPARALAAGLTRQDHVYKTTDELFRFHNQNFDEMRCKLDSTENSRLFEKYPTPPYSFCDNSWGWFLRELSVLWNIGELEPSRIRINITEYVEVSDNGSRQGHRRYEKFEYDVLVNQIFFCCSLSVVLLTARYRKVVNRYPTRD